MESKEAFEFVHFDICGIITPLSNGRKRYIIIFIDDYNKKLSLIFAKLFWSFKRYKSLFENEVSKSINILQTYHGDDYNSYEFALLLIKYHNVLIRKDLHGWN